jgi:tRNA-2-methylthio-N6-dimethylallyladenosine synthase
VLGLLRNHGYDTVDAPGDADVMLVNTCAVRDNAEQRVVGRMGELKRHKRPGVVLGVLGCMAQRIGARILDEAPHVDLVVGPDGYRALPGLIARAADGDRAADVEFKAWEHYEDVPVVRGPGPSAFVTVQRGCDYRCTFCIVPMTRGRERSRRLEDAVREVTDLARQGTTEVTLLGQTVNSYQDGEHDFGALLRAVGAVDGIRRVRFTSPYPTDFTPPVIAAMADVPEVCEHVHLPVQSGSTRLLKPMGRRYTREQYLECVERLRAAIPTIAISTDIIVGFPGETDEDFRETVSFADAYTFRYSPREGTGAMRMPGAVDDRVAAARLDELIGVVRSVARRKNMALVGSTHEVLVEKRARRGDLLQARTRTNKVALVDGPEAWIGTYLDVRLTGTTGATFTGVPTASHAELAVIG